MATTAPADDRVTSLHDDAVDQLVEAHRRRKSHKLLLAVRYKIDDPKDIYLLEVLKDFPGADDEALFEIEYERSPDLLIIGKLHLVLSSPAQLRHAINHNQDVIQAIRSGSAKVEWREKQSVIDDLVNDLGIEA